MEKTKLQDLLEKYPNTPLDDDGAPEGLCPGALGFDVEKCDCDCVRCWGPLSNQEEKKESEKSPVFEYFVDHLNAKEFNMKFNGIIVDLEVGKMDPEILNSEFRNILDSKKRIEELESYVKTLKCDLDNCNFRFKNLLEEKENGEHKIIYLTDENERLLKLYRDAKQANDSYETRMNLIKSALKEKCDE